MQCSSFLRQRTTYQRAINGLKRTFSKRIFVMVCASFAHTLVFTCAATAAQQDTSTTFNIVIAGDMPDISDPVTGRYAELKNLVRSTKKQNTNTFFLYGGGSIGPSAFSNLDKGSHIIDILNNIEPDAMGLAKRDFSFLEDELSLRAYEAAFPFVSSNIQDNRLKSPLDGTSDYALIRKGDISLGFISIIDERVIYEYLTKNISVSSPEDTIRATSTKLREMGADIIVLHYFIVCDFMVSLIDEGIVDIAINSHSRLPEGDKALLASEPKILHLAEPGTAIVANLSFDKSNLSLHDTKVVELAQLAPDPFTQNLINGYKFRLDRILDEQIGSWGADYSTALNDIRDSENAFANAIADTMKQFAGTDIAIVNGGSIRGDKKYNAGGVITRRTIATELPFRSTLRAIEISGIDLLETLEYGLSGLDEMLGTYLHVSGMEVDYNSNKPKGERVVAVRIAGKPLQANESYSLATTDYLANGGDGFMTLTKTTRLSQTSLEETILISDLVLRNIQQQTRITNTVEGRLTDLAIGGE